MTKAQLVVLLILLAFLAASVLSYFGPTAPTTGPVLVH